MVDDSIYMKCPELADPWRQEVEWCLPGAVETEEWGVVAYHSLH
jgi:hypothetical protein